MNYDFPDNMLVERFWCIFIGAAAILYGLWFVDNVSVTFFLSLLGAPLIIMGLFFMGE